MNPVGHIGITVGVARVLRLNLFVVALAVMLPDLVDKPLTLFGIGDGRFVGHSLVFVLGVALLLALRNWRYGLSAGLGGLLHLLQDLPGPISWLYPFVRYEPSGASFNLTKSLTEVSWLSIVPDVVGFLVLAYLAAGWLRARRARNPRGEGHEGSCHHPGLQ